MISVDRRGGKEGIQQVAYPIEHSPLEKRSEKVGIFLPGQDVRKIGMFEEWMQYPAGREVLERGNKYLKENYGYDLLEMAKDIEGEDPLARQERTKLFRETRYTQPAVYLLSIAIHNVNKHHKHKDVYRTIPGYVTGISMGMGTAAVLAGYMDFETGLYFHAERGRIMQEESDPTPTSQITLVGDQAKVVQLLRKGGNETIDLCIINTDKFWVVGGPDNPDDSDSPMQKLRRQASEANLKVREMDTDRSMHGRYVRPARPSFDQLVDSITFQKPHSVVVGSLSGFPIFSETAMKEELKAAFDHTIDNRKPVEFLKEQKVYIVYEVGNEKGFFAKLLGDHRLQVAVGTGLAVAAVGAAEIITHYHPDHPENGKK